MKIIKAALDHPQLVDEHKRADFIVKDGRASFNSKRIKLLDSYEVISYLYLHRVTHLKTVTQQNVPFLLNNKYQEVRSLDEYDFADIKFRQMGRIEGKELKLGKAPFRRYIEKERKYVEATEYNLLYTLILKQ